MPKPEKNETASDTPRVRAPRKDTRGPRKDRGKDRAPILADDESGMINRPRLIGVLIGFVIGFVLVRMFTRASGAPLSDLKVVSGAISEVDKNTRSLADQFTTRDKVLTAKARELEADIAELTQRLDRMGDSTASA